MRKRLYGCCLNSICSDSITDHHCRYNPNVVVLRHILQMENVTVLVLSIKGSLSEITCFVMAREIVNLEYEEDCPSFSNLLWNESYCIHHALKSPYLGFCCALNFHRLRTWVLGNKGVLTADNSLDLSIHDEISLPRSTKRSSGSQINRDSDLGGISISR